MPAFALTEQELSLARQLVRAALDEDLAGLPDLTTAALVPSAALAHVQLVARTPGVFAGGGLLQLVFAEIDPEVCCEIVLEDGGFVTPGSRIARISGPAASLLIAERTCLNFLTFLSGTATLTRRYVDAVAGTSAKILDTRKTIPGLRALQKYAVRCGGGFNHRIGLYDAVLIKDNHLAWWSSTAAATPFAAVQQARDSAPPGTVLEIEVDSLDQLDDVLPARPDIVLLDNMPPDLLVRAVAARDQTAPQVLLEASGGITLETVGEVARCGVDRISVGALTHSAPALDLGFDWE